jgi:hypothetical protein
MFSVAYDSTVSAALALPQEKLRPKAVGVMNLMSVVLRAEPNIAAQRAAFVHHNFDVASVDGLRVLALAMGYAHMAHAPIAGTNLANEKAELALGRRYRRKCVFEGKLCVERGLIPASAFDGIVKGVGYDKTGLGLLGYTHVFRPYLASIESVSALRAGDLDTMQMLGERLIMIGSDRKAPSLAVQTATADMLLRMYTLVDYAYAQVRHGLNYILRDTPEQVRLVAPSVYQLRKTPSNVGQVPAPDTEDKKSKEEERAAAE